MAGLQNTTIRELYTLEETIAAELFDGAVYPWELLPKIGEFIVKLGNKRAHSVIDGFRAEASAE